MSDLIQFAKDLAIDTKSSVERYVGKKVNPLEARVSALEAKLLQMMPTFALEEDPDGRPQVKMVDGSRTVYQHLPCLIDRGVWRADAAYVKGDVVSHNRSQFICQRDHATGKPEDASGDWRLSVMRGRDGKDLR